MVIIIDPVFFVFFIVFEDDFRTRIHCFMNGADGISAVRHTFPFQHFSGGFIGRGVDSDTIRHHKTRQQTNAEPTNIITVRTAVDNIIFGGLTDNG